MRKLKLQVQISLDGYVAGPDGETGWMTWEWDEKLNKYVSDLTEAVDCIIMGRNLAHVFIPHWSAVAANPDSAEFEFGKKMTDTRKVVFSKTLNKTPETPEWENTTVVNDDLVQEVEALKRQVGDDIIVYGGATFVSSLIRENMIDELYLFINPVAVGKGMAIFKGRTDLKLKTMQAFACGIVVLVYQPAVT